MPEIEIIGAKKEPKKFEINWGQVNSLEDMKNLFKLFGDIKVTDEHKYFDEFKHLLK